MYGDATAYAKYLQKKVTTPCADCPEEESSADYCECCPPGLVEVKNADGSRSGCLTPQDAETFIEATRSCNEGYVKLMKTSTSEFLGCVPSDEFAELYAAVNPV